MKNLKYLLVGLVLIASTACENYFFDNKLDHETVIAEKRNFAYTLTDDDYKTIADSKAAQALAAKLDAEAGEGSTVYTDALALVGANKSFNATVTAKEFLTFALRVKFPELDKGSLCTVTYNIEEETGAAEAPDPSKLTYTGDTINATAADAQLKTLTPDHTADKKTVYVKDGDKNKVFYVKGIVIGEKLDVSTQYGNATLYISDGTNKLYCYRVKDVDDAAITDANRLQVNDVVVLKGNLGVYLASEGATPSYQLVNGSIVSVARTVTRKVEEKTEIYVLANEWMFSIYFQEPFIGHGQGDFEIINIETSGLPAVWQYDASYGMKASGYSTSNLATESWLISPQIDLSDAANPVLVFEQAQKYAGTFEKECLMYVSTSYTTGATAIDSKQWTALDFNKDKDGKYIVPEPNFVFISTGQLDLSAYKGQKIYLGFRYTSSTTAAATWEIKNLFVKEAE